MRRIAIAAACLAFAWAPVAAKAGCTGVGPVTTSCSSPTPTPSPTSQPPQSQTPQPQPSAGNSGQASQADTVDLERQFFDLVNHERGARGMGSLAYNPKLSGVARGHSSDMASSGRLYHNNAELQSSQFYRDMGNPTMVGENVGDGPSVKWLHEAFMDSSEHRSNILESRYTSMGIGVSVRDNTIWVTEDFIRGGTVRRGAFPISRQKIRSPSGDNQPAVQAFRQIFPAQNTAPNAAVRTAIIAPKVSALRLPPVPAPLPADEPAPGRKPLIPLAVLATLSAVAFASRRDAGAWI